MIAFVLVSGALSRAPEVKTAKSGKPYVKAPLENVATSSVAVRIKRSMLWGDF